MSEFSWKDFVTRNEINQFLFVSHLPCCRRSSVRAARGLMIMINCQSVQVFEWPVVQATTTTAGEPSVLGWLLAWWTPYQNDHRTPLLRKCLASERFETPAIVLEHRCKSRQFFGGASNILPEFPQNVYATNFLPALFSHYCRGTKWLGQLPGCRTLVAGLSEALGT